MFSVTDIILFWLIGACLASSVRLLPVWVQEMGIIILVGGPFILLAFALSGNWAVRLYASVYDLLTDAKTPFISQEDSGI